MSVPVPVHAGGFGNEKGRQKRQEEKNKLPIYLKVFFFRFQVASGLERTGMCTAGCVGVVCMIMDYE